MGKSAFAPLLIAYLAHKRRPVIYRHLTAFHETLVMMDFRSTPFQCRIASYSAELQIRWEVSGAIERKKEGKKERKSGGR